MLVKEKDAETGEDLVLKRKTFVIIARKPVIGPMNAWKVHVVEGMGVIEEEEEEDITEDVIRQAQVKAEVDIVEDTGVEIDIGTEEEEKDLLPIQDQDPISHFLPHFPIFLDQEAEEEIEIEEDPVRNLKKNDQKKVEVNNTLIRIGIESEKDFLKVEVEIQNSFYKK